MNWWSLKEASMQASDILPQQNRNDYIAWKGTEWADARKKASVGSSDGTFQQL
jgi:hypothetical protein